MGIKGLTKLIGDNCGHAMREGKLENYFGRKVAIDASMAIYQFMIAVRSGDGQAAMLTNEAGEVTSHLQGLFHRTIRMLECGIKPCYVFDGKAPDLKSGELAARREKREAAEKALAEAQEAGDNENVDKFSKRSVRVTKEHNEEAKKLLRLMGIPVVEAPTEAEAQCAALAKAGKVFAVGSEDMDSLTFGSTVLLRHLTFSEARKMPVLEFTHATVLEELNLSEDQFIDLCILMGCDYTGTLRGIGPKTALTLIRKHGSLAEILKHNDAEKHPVPENFNHEEIHAFFKNPDVTDPATLELKWEQPDEEGLIQFLCAEKQFNEDRVKKSIEKLKKTRSVSTQQRLDSFFGTPTIKRAAPAGGGPAGKKAKGGPAAKKANPFAKRK